MLMLLAASVIRSAGAYSQFTHEELIDLTWSDTIRPLLMKRYPGASERELVRAHAYAYGGSIIQDVGYYPFGKRFFSDLAHYARSGDFVSSLLRNAATLDEFAFALGALSHYIGDAIGHSLGVNPATAITFPELGARFGATVTYEDAPTAHVRTEFGFDVAQTANHNYAARRYRKRIGFRVARPLLYRSFYQTYGFPASGLLGPAHSAAGSYRWSVTTLLPAFLAAQLVLLSERLPAPVAPATDALSREADHSEYAALGLRANVKPGIRADLLAILVRIIPKVGVLKVLATRPPSTSTEDLFTASTGVALRELRIRFSGVANGATDLPNLDLDTGSDVSGEQSKIVDDTHVKFAIRVAGAERQVPPAVREYLLSYFGAPNRMNRLRANAGALAELKGALERLRQER
jgi:hypothetical protein